MSQSDRGAVEDAPAWPPERGAPDSSARMTGDAGAAWHHWGAALAVGAVLGAVEVFTAWIVVRVLF